MDSTLPPRGTQALPESSRGNPELKRAPPTTVILCRHGETDWNLEKRFQGLVDIPLNAAGRRQAVQIAFALKNSHVSAVWASPLRRTTETGSIVARQCGVSLNIDERLIERDLGRMQGLTSKEVRKSYPQFWEAWKTMGVPFPPEAEVENPLDAISRMESALFEFAAAHPGGTIVVVSHGALIRCLLHQAVGTASITTLVVGPGRSWRRVKFNETRHLKGFSDHPALPMPGVGAEGVDLVKAGKSTTIVLCRHGETDWTLAGRFQGTEDVPLNSHGCGQALLLADLLRSEDLFAVCSSPSHRARETAVAVAAASGLVLNLDDRLRPRHLGVLQNRLPAEVSEKYPGVMIAWKNSETLPPEADAEPIEDVNARVEAALFDLAETYPGKKVAVISHAEVIRCVLKRAVGEMEITTPGSFSFSYLSVGPGRVWQLIQRARL